MVSLSDHLIRKWCLSINDPVRTGIKLGSSWIAHGIQVVAILRRLVITKLRINSELPVNILV